MKECYKEDLAYIHDVGHSDYLLNSSPEILDILAQNNIRPCLVVDLVCGSGLSALEFTKANYRVLGVDVSESLIGLPIACIVWKDLARSKFLVWFDFCSAKR